MEADIIGNLEEKARVLRARVLQMIAAAPAGHPGHPGGSLSAADIVAALYFGVMNVRPQEPNWPDRDRFVISKGHSVPVLYAALAEKGYFPVETLLTLRRPGSILQGHPDMNKTPGIDMSSGSLGQGLSAAIGMAIGGKIDNRSYRVYALLSDGEQDEGQVWEAAMTAAKYKLDNLTAIVDCNGLQNDGFTKDIMPLGNLAAKWRSFGWMVSEVNGHSMAELYAALRQPAVTAPTMIIAHTVKGKGVSFMENKAEWHAGGISADQLAQALADIGWQGGALA